MKNLFKIECNYIVKLIYSLIIVSLILISSCDFKDTNLDPTRPLDAELKEILPTAITQTVHNYCSIGGRVTGTVIQHFKGIDAQPESYSQYLIDERTLDEFWRTGLFGGAMKDCDLIIEKAIEADQPYYQGIAKILMAINLGIATSFWGEVPYSEAFNGIENLQPKYDSQQDIYNSIQNLLSEAIILLNENSVENEPSIDDLVFNGDAQKWIGTAYALKARYFIHLSKRNLNAAQNAINAIKDGAFKNLSFQPDFNFGNSINEAHPLPLFCFERPDQIVMGDHLFQKLSNQNDPRLNYLTVVENDIPKIFKMDSLQLFWGKFDTHLPLISLTEIKFIEAEALLRLGEKENAEIVFKEAVIGHFEQMNISFIEYENFVDNHIYFDTQWSEEEQLEFLLHEKYIALFSQNSIETWVDYRRTDFPKLIPPVGANSSLNPSLIIPKRYLYPISERNTNKENMENAIQRQGGHLLDDNIWLFE